MSVLPPPFHQWFKHRGWSVHPHQIDLFERADAPANLLIAPTGGGKTLAGFLPSLHELSQKSGQGLHSLYISPLKALAADIRRNLQTPITDMGLNIRVEDRTGDTPYSKKQRQRADPPDILLTTPESLALLLSYEDAPRIFKSLRRVIIDEVHALAESKRGDQLMLCLSRLAEFAPDMVRVGLSATVEDPPAVAQFMAPHPQTCDVLLADPGPAPDITMLKTPEPPPWSGAGAIYSIPAVLDEIHRAKTTLIFINTRAQAEIYFHALWQANTDDLPIGLHHGSLSREARDKVEAAMVRGALRAIVCTGSLDLGIDWGNVDLVVQVGAPKNIKRLVQRIGRSNHRYNAPSRAIVVPSNRFEIIECVAALQAVRENDLDGDPRPDAPLDVLCQHILLTACSGPFSADVLYDQIVCAGPYTRTSRDTFDACLAFCATGGYALRAYDRWQRIMQRPDGHWHLRDPRRAQSIRMNVGTIVDTQTLAVRLRNRRGGTPLGEVEEAFAATLTPGDTFLIGGQTVRYEGLRDMTVEVTKQTGKKPRIAVFSGTKFATSTQLSHRIIRFLNAGDWTALPDHMAQWLTQQAEVSSLPHPDRMLVESFVRHDLHYTCIYGFAGRNALQTLGLLLTRRMEETGLHPVGFVSTDYALLIWGLEPVIDAAALLSEDGLRDGLDVWLGKNAVMKRSFRSAATIAGLIEKNYLGKRKSGRQATFSSDILYDTIRKYDPDHLLMRITRAEAMRGLVDYSRIEEMLRRTAGRIDHTQTAHVTPFAAPLFLEMGKVPIKGRADARLIEEQSAKLMREAGLK